MRKEVPLEFATRLINHGPVIVVSSLFNDKVNLTPVAWNMPISKNPPEIIIEVGRSHFMFDCILETEDFVINIPSKDFIEDVVKCGSCSGRDVDKVDASNFEIQPSKSIKSPNIKNVPAILECELIKDEYLLKEYNLIPGKVKYAEAEEGII